jgi:hypothetical protein
MKAKELRIGNYYDHNGEIKTVTPNTILEVWEAIRTWCKAIPLTEKWLLKLGFTKDNYGCFYLSRIDENENNLWLKTQENNIGVALNMFHLERKQTYLNNVEYVHQLQNLYFALTGEELVVSDAVS